MSSSTKSAFTGRYDTIPGLYSTIDLSAAQFKVVMMLSTTPGQIKLAGTSVIARSAFVLQNAPKGTSTLPVNAEVANFGIVKAIAGTSLIKSGDKLGVNTTSYVVNTTTTNRFIIGSAMGNSSTIGDIIPVLLEGGGGSLY